MRFRFLGTSDSGGIPVHNCKCIACDNFRKKQQTNLATCAVLEDDEGVILFDAGDENISTIFDGKKIKAVMLTHFHADHALGLLRLRYSNDKIKCYHPKDEMGFSDLFKHKISIEYIQNTPLKAIKIDDITMIPVPLIHSKNTTGYIIKTPNSIIAYLTDCGGIEDKYMNILKDIKFDHVFVDACFIPPKKGNHLNYNEATKFLDTLDVKNGYLIHQDHKNLTYIMENKIRLKYKYIEKDFCIDI